MEKENKKIKEKYIKEERNRINKLVTLAKKNDPRMKAEENRKE